MECRQLETEFRLVRKLTETKEHLSNFEEISKKKSGQVNRYSEIKPYKHTVIKLAQRGSDVYDGYINANYVSTS
jgi:protein tyrosine phosphatase